ncbi:hypothetical protein [Roseomonas nitratireducens]|nr:hypothetical protein [Neoroseomonas nitratireducens]
MVLSAVVLLLPLGEVSVVAMTRRMLRGKMPVLNDMDQTPTR